MPSLAKHQSNKFTKMLLMGDPGTGKTGSCVSLLGLGLHLRFLDLDNGLDSFKQFALRDYPDKVEGVEYRTLRDKYKATALGPIVQSPRAFVDAIKMLDNWKYDDIDLGPPYEWGPDCVLILDSTTLLGDAAFAWADPLTPRGKQSGEADKRQTYGIAQGAIRNVLKLLTSEGFQTNVIVISHVRYIDTETGRKGYPTAVGEALSTQIGQLFNSIALCQTQAGGKRTIQTAATSMIDLKNPKPFEMEPRYPLETGLADFFKVLREGTQPKLEVVHAKRRV
jgi:hypothetical protein